jgi:hypothetical protein
MGLAYNSTGRYVFRLPAMPLSYQGIATAICIITISVLALTEYPGDVFPGAGFNKDFPVSGSCTDNFSGSVYRMRGCPCASPPADYGCQPSFICDILEGFPTKPNICVEHQFTQKGYQAGTSVTIPPRTVAPCVRLTRCSLCTDRVTCGWCGEQCIDNTGSTMCPTNIAFSCEPEAATTTTSTTTTLVGPTGNPPTTPGEPIEPISAPNGGVTTTTAAAIITTSTIARPQDSTNTQFFAPTDDDASGSNTIAIAAGAGGGAAFLIIVGIIIGNLLVETQESRQRVARRRTLRCRGTAMHRLQAIPHNHIPVQDHPQHCTDRQRAAATTTRLPRRTMDSRRRCRRRWGAPIM